MLQSTHAVLCTQRKMACTSLNFTQSECRRLQTIATPPLLPVDTPTAAVDTPTAAVDTLTAAVAAGPTKLEERCPSFPRLGFHLMRSQCESLLPPHCAAQKRHSNGGDLSDSSFQLQLKRWWRHGSVTPGAGGMRQSMRWRLAGAGVGTHVWGCWCESVRDTAC
jgi:hypothetical protein